MARRTAFARADLAALLVVTLLAAALAPVAWSGSTGTARQVRGDKNLQQIGTALAGWTAGRDTFPIAYAYGADARTTAWEPDDQTASHPNPALGYVHWSALLRDAGLLASFDVFVDPGVRSGGAPATNPGGDVRDWEPGQTNDLGGGPGAVLPHDRQAPRLAYTANAALLPRNKLNVQSPRSNRFVAASEIAAPSTTIAVAEWLDLDALRPIGTGGLPATGAGGWQGLAVPAAGAGASRYLSHRPVTPFLGVSAGTNVFHEPDVGGPPRFVYPDDAAIRTAANLGAAMIEDPQSELNALGRHQAGGDALDGGPTLVLMADGSIRRVSVRQSVIERLWGDRFHALTGNNAVWP